MSLFAISAILIGAPFVAQLRGSGSAGLMLTAAATYALYLASAYIATFVLPDPSGARLMGFLTGTTDDAAYGTVPPQMIVAMGNTAMRGIVAFSALAVVIWLLRRRGAPTNTKRVKLLFWTLVLSLSGVFIYAGTLAIAPVAPTFDLSAESYAEKTFGFAIAGLVFAQWAAIFGLAVTLCWAIVQRQRTRAL